MRIVCRKVLYDFAHYFLTLFFHNCQHREQYFAKCEAVINKWRVEGPKPLNTGWDVTGVPLENPPEYTSGIFLFLDRQNITHFFPPNFLPPYDTPDKRKIILEFLCDEWDEKTVSWKPVLGSEGRIKLCVESELVALEIDKSRLLKRARSPEEST